jgi:2-oxo-4-hydroxy-4-carboxy-5-ureidoimidazoline decarboxylase
MRQIECINALSEPAARAEFLQCCGSARWAAQLAARRPYDDDAHLCAVAVETWRARGRADWLEAFAAHPRIGDLDALREKFAVAAAWSAEEQKGVAGAAEATLSALVDGNRRYEARFGFIFLVCATGKTASEMLSLLERRLGNSPEDELHNAAAEQEKIMLLRLGKLCT